MKDGAKSKEQLKKELSELRKRITNLERLEAEHNRVEVALKESEERLRLLTQSAEDVIVMQDLAGKYLYFNSPPKYGIRAEEVIGKTPFDLHEPENAAMFIERLNQVVKSGKSLTFETRLNWKGEVIWFFDQTSPVRDNAGNIKALVTISRNITEHKRAEEALRESEEQYRELADSISDVFFAMDKDLKYIFWNKASEKLTGILAKDAIGKSISEIFPKNKETKRAIKVYKKVIKTHQPQTFINEYHLENERYFFEINAYPSFKGGVSVFVKDITRRKHTEEALRKSEESYHNLFENSPVPLWEVDFSKVKRYIDGLRITGDYNLRAYFMGHPDEIKKCISLAKINNVNKAALELFKINSTNDFKQGIFKFLSFKSYKGITEAIVALSKGEPNFKLEVVIQTLSNEKIHVLLKGSIAPGYENTMGKILITVIDLTEQKLREEEMKRGMMKFNLEEGNLYLVTEQTPVLSIEAFNDILNVGYPGLAISRTTANKLKRLFSHDLEFIWLADANKDGVNTLKPNLKKFEQYLKNQPNKCAILIDRLDYVISKNGFKKTLDFIHFLKELAYINDHIIIISVDPLTLDKNKLRQFEKESLEIEPREKIKLPLDLLDVLIFIIKQNLIGIRPKYSQIENELGISKPTVRKRIGILMSKGYVLVNTKGNTKVVEATEKGKRFF